MRQSKLGYFATFIATSFAFVASALAQGPGGGPGGGPSPAPSPWILNGSSIYYQNGGVIVGAPSLTGGNEGVGTINVSGNYYINGVALSALPCTLCAVTNATNTFTAIQIDQGATTTSPGWYTQIAGDTTPRVRVGLNATDVASIAFGPGNAVRDAFIERLGAGALRFGAPDAAVPVAQMSSVQNVVAGTSNAAGANRTIAGSQGTGTGAGGNIIFQVAPAGGSGSSQNALVTALTIFSNESFSFAAGGSFSGALTGITTLSMSGQLTSTLTTGTAPFSVASTTNVANLNASSLNGATFSAPGAIGGGTASSGAFTTLTASTSLAINGCTIGSNALCATGTAAISGALTSAAQAITSASANALAVGLNGATNPAFNVDASTASQVAGLDVVGAATGGTVAVKTTDSGSNNNLTINAKGTGTIGIGSISTGAVTITPATTLSGALTYGGVTLSNSVSGTGSMALTAGTTFTGTTTVGTLAATTINGAALSGTFSGTPTLSGANFITLANIVQSTAGAQFLGVTGSSAANYAPFTLASLTALASPSATLDLLPCVDHVSGTIKSCTPSAIASAVGSGVTSLNGATGAVTLLIEAQGRLTLTANTPVMTATASAQTTLRYDCYNGGQVPYYDGTQDRIDTISSCEVTDAMVSAASAGQVVSGNVYDAWWVHGGTNRICLAMSASTGGGGGWSSDSGGSNTARGTGYTQLDRVTRPYTTNKNSISNCFNGATNYGSVSANQGTYLGTVYASANGQISWTLGAAASGGTAALLGVWNMYNRVTVATAVQDNGTAYTYTTGSFRQARASAGNQIQFVMGLPEDGIPAAYSGRATGVAALASNPEWGLGVMNSTTTEATSGCLINGQSATTASNLACADSYTYAPVSGFNTIAAIEAGDGTNANTFDVAGRNVLSTALRM